VHLTDPTVSNVCHKVTWVNDAPAEFPIGITIVNWTGTEDDCGLTVKCTQTVCVVGPIIVCDTGDRVNFGVGRPFTLEVDPAPVVPAGLSVSYQWIPGLDIEAFADADDNPQAFTAGCQTGTATMKVLVTVSGTINGVHYSVTCPNTYDVVIWKPSTDHSIFAGWTSSTIGMWNATLIGFPATVDFSGATVKHSGGAIGNDTCWFATSMFQKFNQVSTQGPWTVGGGNTFGWIGIGPSTTMVNYYFYWNAQVGLAHGVPGYGAWPCSMTCNEVMSISCLDDYTQYATIPCRIDIGPSSKVGSRRGDAAEAWTQYPPP